MLPFGLTRKLKKREKEIREQEKKSTRNPLECWQHPEYKYGSEEEPPTNCMRCWMLWLIKNTREIKQGRQ